MMDDGAATLTVMVTMAVALPPVLVAVTVYDVEDEMAVGVPLMAPVDVSKERPAGSVPEIDHDVTVPPEVGGDGRHGTSFVKESELGE